MKNKSIISQLIIFVVIAAVFIILGSSGSSPNINKEEENMPKADKLEIYYFYATQRCDVCITLENFIKETVNEYFSEELQSGIIIFDSINVDLPENREVVNKYQARGAALYINSIYDNKNHIQEEVNAWRYVNNKTQFKDYLSSKIKSGLND